MSLFKRIFGSRTTPKGLNPWTGKDWSEITAARERERLASKPLRDLDTFPQADRGFTETDITELGVYSSWIASIEHDHDTLQLTIRTKDHGDLIYLGVPEAVYDDFFAAASKGVFYNMYIKGRYHYAGRKLA